MSSSASHAGSSTSNTTKMAVSATKPTLPSAEGKSTTAAKMHRRSRSGSFQISRIRQRIMADEHFPGCFTCRLRRKKCEEGKPSCKACHHLGLRCDYKRPMWWSNGEQRRLQKERIKDVIKQTQVSKKGTQAPQLQSATTPPPLCHSISSVPTSAEVYTDSTHDTRASSVDTPFSGPCDFPHMSPDSYFQIPPR